MSYFSSVPVAAGIANIVGSVTASVVASSACGPNSQASEPSDLLRAYFSSNIRVDDGLKWGNSNGSTVNKAAYTAEMTEMVIGLADANLDLGILTGSKLKGFNASWTLPRHIHVYWAFGVGDHTNVHTSLAFAYKSDHSTQDLYVMMKVDLQTVTNRAGGNKDMAWKGGAIHILHEFKLIDGINTQVWKEKKGVYEMSMEDVIAVLHTVVNKTDPIYDWLSNNCIGFKNEVLEDAGLSSKLKTAENIPDIPAKNKVADIPLKGVAMMQCSLSPITLRPSPLGPVKRKCMLEDGEAGGTPSKRHSNLLSITQQNSYRFKNEVLEDTNLSSKLDSTEGIPNIPEKDKVEDTRLEGVGMIKVPLK